MNEFKKFIIILNDIELYERNKTKNKIYVNLKKKMVFLAITALLSFLLGLFSVFIISLIFCLKRRSQMIKIENEKDMNKCLNSRIENENDYVNAKKQKTKFIEMFINNDDLIKEIYINRNKLMKEEKEIFENIVNRKIKELSPINKIDFLNKNLNQEDIENY